MIVTGKSILKWLIDFDYITLKLGEKEMSNREGIKHLSNLPEEILEKENKIVMKESTVIIDCL
jgi:hypothetical protein